MKQGKAVLKISKKVGSMTKLASEVGCTCSSISHWANERRIIPAKYVKKLVELSEGEVTKKDLRPDLYDD